MFSRRTFFFFLFTFSFQGVFAATTTPTSTESATSSETRTFTESATPTESATVTPSATVSDTPTESASETPSATESDTLTVSATASPTPTETPTPPPGPVGLQALCGNRSVYLSWDTAGFASFEVYRDSVLLTTSPITIGVYQDQAVTNLVLYDYSVVGLDGGGNPSQPSQILFVEPAMPPIPGGSPAIRVTQSLGLNTLTIQVGEPAAGGYPAVSYEVLRSSDGGNSFVTLPGAPSGAGPLTYEDNDIASGVEYWYSVRASDGRVPCASVALYPTIKVPPLDYRLSISRNRLNPKWGETAEISLSLLDSSSVRLVVFTPSGLKVRVLIEGEFPAGEKSVFWDGRNDRGSVVAPGVYILHAEIKAAGKSKSLTGQVGVLY